MIHQSTFIEVVQNRRRSRWLRRGGAIAPVLAWALGACNSPAGELPISQLGQPILGGVVDRTHPAVMLLAHRAGFLCTGTVIHVERDIGYLLTAAHCVTEESEDEPGLVPLDAKDFIVVPGADFAESTTAFSVKAVSVEPSYDGSFAADVALVRFFFGTQPAPPVIPALGLSEDTLAAGDALLLVGYGQTELDEANTERRRVERNVEELDRELVVYTQEDGKGACFGDSGGPVLVEVGRQERVAAVISGGVNDSDEGCAGGLGVAMRVSAYQTFIDGVLAQRIAD